MASNQATLTLAGDSKDLERAFDRVGAASKEMAGDVGRASREMATAADRLDDVGEAAGTADTRAMGFRDAITGVQDSAAGLRGVMKNGFSPENLLLLGMGFGDLASAVENLGAPLLKAAKTHAKAMVSMVANAGKAALSNTRAAVKIAATWTANAAKAAASVAVSVARQVVAWTVLGAKSLLAAAKVALAWMISMGPIILVGAAVIALVVLIVKNWDTIKEVIAKGWEFVKRVTSATWDAIKSGLSAAWDFIKGIVDAGGAAVGAVVRFYVDKWRTIITTAWNVIKTVFTTAWRIYRTIVETGLNFITARVKGQFARIRAVITIAWNVIRTLTTAAWNAIKRIVTTVIDRLRTAAKSRIDRIVGFFSDMKGRVGRALAGLPAKVAEPFRKAYLKAKEWLDKIPGLGGGLSVGGFSLGSIPGLATGGIVKATPGGTVARIGEGGRDEAVVPLPRGGMPMGGGITTLEINSGGSQLDDLLVEVLRRSVRIRGGDVVAVLGG